MSIRTINISLEEQYPRPRTVGFWPDQTALDNELLLDEVYIAKTNASGVGSIDLPVRTAGTIHYRVEIDGEDIGSFYLSAGSPINLEDLLNVIGLAPPTESLIDYINAALGEYAPIAGADFTGDITAPRLKLLDPNYIPFLGGTPWFTLGHIVDAMPVGNTCFDIVDIYYTPTADGQVQIGRLTQMKPWGSTINGALYANYATVDNRGDNGVTNSFTASYGAVNNEHTSKLGQGGYFSAFSGGSGADNTVLLIGVQGAAGGAHNCTLQQGIAGDFFFSTSSSSPSTTALAKILHAWSRHNPGHDTTDLRAISIDGHQSLGGTVQKTYGLYMDDSLRIGALENWGLYLLTTAPSAFSGPVRVPDDAFGPTWNGSFEVPTKNAIYDAFDDSFSTQAADYRRKAIHFTDFSGASQSSAETDSFQFVQNGSGFFNAQQNVDYNDYPTAYGIQLIGLGTVANREGVIGELDPNGSGVLRFGQFRAGQVKYKIRAGFVTLSDVTNTYVTRMGFSDAGLTATPVRGCFFRYTNSVNSGKWQAVCMSGGVETAQDTGATPVGDKSLHTFEVIVNAGGTSVGFYIDGVLTNTITTNIPPNGAGNSLGACFQLQKSAGTAPNLVAMALDYMRSEWNFTTPRP